MFKKLIILLPVLILLSCSEDENLPDAYGNFEANEIIVSSEGTGKIVNFQIIEGEDISQNQEIGLIDTTDLYLKKLEIDAAIASINAKTRNVQADIDVLEEQLSNLIRERDRFNNMKEDGAATDKQLDDINGQIDVVKKQINATKSNLNTANRGLLAEIPTLKAKKAQIENALMKCKLISPVNGTILTKYAEENEFTAMGKPLYKIADLSKLELRVYLQETQLARVKLGDEVKVSIDDDNGSKDYSGKIITISDKAEFTPKIIQTKEERKNLVYAAKVLVENDGSLKIGMPGEIYFK